MIRSPTAPNRAVTIVLIVLCTAGTTTLLAQQPGVTPVMEGRMLQATSPAASLPGPRLTPELPSFEPRLADSSAPARLMLASGGSNHTFVFSTLVLVLIGVIIVLLVV